MDLRNTIQNGNGMSKEILDEFRLILKEEYGMEPSEAEAKEMAQNIINFYGTAERLLNQNR